MANQPQNPQQGGGSQGGQRQGGQRQGGSMPNQGGQRHQDDQFRRDQEQTEKPKR